MKRLIIIILLLSSLHIYAQNDLPVYNALAEKNYSEDWLVLPATTKASVYKSADNKNIILYNGLVKRTFHLEPNITCIEYKNMSNGQQLLRAVKPEAEVTISGVAYNIGGLYGQTENAYLLAGWVDGFNAHDSDFHYASFEVNRFETFHQLETQRVGHE
jgi:hypothetical protein